MNRWTAAAIGAACTALMAAGVGVVLAQHDPALPANTLRCQQVPADWLYVYEQGGAVQAKGSPFRISGGRICHWDWPSEMDGTNVRTWTDPPATFTLAGGGHISEPGSSEYLVSPTRLPQAGGAAR